MGRLELLPAGVSLNCPFAVGTKLPFRTLAAGLTLKASAGEMLGRTELIT